MRVWFSTNAPRNAACPGRNAISPVSMQRVMTCVASPVKRTFSGETRLTVIVLAMSGRALLQRLRLGEHLLHTTDVEERLLGHFVELALDDRLEALDGL